MNVGDLVRVTKEFGKYWYMNEDISGMVGTITRTNKSHSQVEIFLANGKLCMITSAHAWLEVLNEAR